MATLDRDKINKRYQFGYFSTFQFTLDHLRCPKGGKVHCSGKLPGLQEV